MANLTDQELLEYYYQVKAESERYIHRKWNPYKKVTHQAYMELIRRGLK